MRHPIVLAAAVLLSTACATSGASSGEPAPMEVKSTGVPGEAAGVYAEKVRVTVKAVDVASRALTVESKDGQTQTLKVGPEVRRLDEIGPGDTIMVQLKQGLLLQYQPAGTDAVPPQAVAVGDVAGASSAPGAAVAGGVQGTVTIVGLDAKSRVVTFQTPAGNQYRVKAGPELALEKLKIGDRLLATYVETLAIAVEKAGAM